MIIIFERKKLSSTGDVYNIVVKKGGINDEKVDRFSFAGVNDWSLLS